MALLLSHIVHNTVKKSSIVCNVQSIAISSKLQDHWLAAPCSCAYICLFPAWPLVVSALRVSKGGALPQTVC